MEARIPPAHDRATLGTSLTAPSSPTSSQIRQKISRTAETSSKRPPSRGLINASCDSNSKAIASSIRLTLGLTLGLPIAAAATSRSSFRNRSPHFGQCQLMQYLSRPRALVRNASSQRLVEDEPLTDRKFKPQSTSAEYALNPLSSSTTLCSPPPTFDFSSKTASVRCSQRFDTRNNMDDRRFHASKCFLVESRCCAR